MTQTRRPETKPDRNRTRPLFGRLSAFSAANLASILRSEKVGCLFLLSATIIALVWANQPDLGYEAIRSAQVGIPALHLELTIGQWAGDGLLAVFFFVVGLELKREFTIGDFRTLDRAAIPIVAAIGGMAVPAIIYLGINFTMPNGSLDGWAIPAATDTAFAVAIIAIVTTSLPGKLRAFLLSAAVVDDVIAITIIAVFYAVGFSLPALLASLAAIAVFGFLVQRRVRNPLVLVPIALVAWYFMHASGVHATLTGVLLGLTVPAMTRPTESESLADRFEHRMRPISAAVAVPAFALFTAGVSLEPEMLGSALRDPVAIGVALGLVVGKPLGIFGATYLAARFTRARMDKGLAWCDVLGVSAVAGIGFTVSLLITELAFGETSLRTAHVKLAIFAGSLLAAAIGTIILAARSRAYRNLSDDDDDDDDEGTTIDASSADGTATSGQLATNEQPTAAYLDESESWTHTTSTACSR